MKDLRLVIFDVDGTLVDSQAHIFWSMEQAFHAAGLDVPSREDVLHIVGLSLPQAMLRLAPDASDEARGLLVSAYKSSYAGYRSSRPPSPLYPGARAALDALQAQPHTLLAVATGKSRRGVAAMVEVNRLQGVFLSQQTADDHPSKPHPSMIEACMADLGVGPERTVMIGDTSFDMDMARAAGVKALAVTWGYHADLQADAKIESFDALLPVLDQLIGA